ncbi:type II toxin-antitoxin system RelE/ParE family toxin [bacterium]|nr:type II toxin-antitoxin system RelE/ParE family toxin [bacterium]
MEILKTDGFENIYEVDRFQKEFREVTNDEKRYSKWLIARLTELDLSGIEVIRMEAYEALKTNPKLYVIRYPHSKLNLRIMFVFVNSNEILLLNAFKESSKKSNSDYLSAIAIAQKRLRYVKDCI